MSKVPTIFGIVFWGKGEEGSLGESVNGEIGLEDWGPHVFGDFFWIYGSLFL